MEGPSVKIIAEKLARFKGKKVMAASGNARIEKEDLQGKDIKGIFKNFLLEYLIEPLRRWLKQFGMA